METNYSDRQIARVHRRQFVIGPRGFLTRTDWRTFQLNPGLILSVDPDLRVGIATDLDGISWFLLGIAVDTRPDFGTPLEEISRHRTEKIQSLYMGWSGRWVLVGGGCLYPDATAMLGCYYGKSSQGECWASSSPVLINHCLGLQAASQDGWQPLPDATETGQVRGISWYPPPNSAVFGVFRLLPSQILNLYQGTCKLRSLIGSIDPQRHDKDLLQAITVACQTTISRLATINSPHQLTLLLSGGKDSRLLLSTAASAGIPLKTFTRIHRRASLADRILPPKLAHITGYSHTKHYQRYEIPGRRQIILAHSGYNLSWLSAEEFLCGGSDSLRGIALAGFCAALGRERLIPITSTQDATGEILARHYGEESNSAVVEAFEAWIALRRMHSDDGLDLCDYYFLEQRTAGRKGIKEQIFDLFPAERVPPLNSARLFTLICNLSPDTKLKALWIPEIIKSTMPELLKYPMNPPDKYFGFIRNTLLNNRFYKQKLLGLQSCIR